ncbi:hypothetical protein MNAN1_000976 [Malassezia nana]|uniref:Uncharacterized protein n=1 Tax=Malassezia nana TaxID=180528 RepID=A0AAF0J1F4_9BASI|nr:hypothetical protein MNAN1_000976 [Malassezia nana]
MPPRLPGQNARRQVLAPIAVAGSVVLLLAAVYRWSKKASDSDTPKPVTKPPTPTQRKPTLSVSLPVDPTWKSKAIPIELHEMVRGTQADYDLHVLVHAPDGEPVALPCDKVLAYANAQGRAMMQRALQCQFHVELVFVDEQGWMAWDPQDNLQDYLARLDQLAQVVDKMLLVLMPAAPAPNAIALRDLEQSWKKHTISQHPQTQWLDLRSTSWRGLQEALAQERQGWN